MKKLKKPTISKKLKLSKKLVAIAAIVLALAVLSVGAYVFNRQASDSSQLQQEQTEVVEERPEEQRERLQEYEEAFESSSFNELPDEQKINMYISAAFISAALQESEAKDYAATALSLMTDEFKEDENNSALIESLSAIERGENETDTDEE